MIELDRAPENIKIMTLGHEQIVAARSLDEKWCGEVLHSLETASAQISADEDTLLKHGHSIHPMFLENKAVMDTAHKTIQYLMEMANTLAQNDRFAAADEARSSGEDL